jgi:C-methyltransferase C-terminal domain/Putative zinc binding domain/Methyltransferase domain
MNCRHCNAPISQPFLDLGFAPPSNSYLSADGLSRPAKYYPLRIKVCDRCWLVQTEDYVGVDELFSPEYAYFSSTSKSWLVHAAHYSKKIIKQLNLDSHSLVIEIASNDGYLLRNFVAAGVPCLGIEPTASTAAAAEALHIPVLRDFFTESLAKRLAAEGQQADLIVGNNVYAHVPAINDFTKGLKILLKVGGTITLEFPHLTRLIEDTQFDTAYHEHFSYFSLGTVERIFKAAALRIYDVEELSTHGGSLRIYGCHADDTRRKSDAVVALLALEARQGFASLGVYGGFQAKVDRVKNDFLFFLLQQKREGKTVAAYGAAAKGNTLLNYAGVKRDLLSFVCDAAPAKQGKFMPGSQIPILAPAALSEWRPDYLLILPWNIADEIKQQNVNLGRMGTKFVTAVPKLEIA